jgi:oligopeptide transport system ATP-binding protein
MALLTVRDLRVSFHTRHGIVRAVGGVSFDAHAGQTTGIVGESGSGKSVTCYSLLGLIPRPPAKIEGGTAHFRGTDLLTGDERAMRSIRGKDIGMIFQDPMNSLNPYLRIGTQLIEPLTLHKGLSKSEAMTQAAQALADVGIVEPERRLRQYPHEFSGGMRQRVMIAMALITEPGLIIADEPTTALDVTIQKQVLDLLRERQRALQTGVIFITHDLAVVSEICDTVYVMYAGRIIESAAVADLFARPRHAYTRALLRSIPARQKKGEALYTIPGAPPNLAALDGGCAFRERNEEHGHRCLTTSEPPLVEAAPGHWVQECPGCLA